ncbi:hypothetical protein HYV84_03690 [Candidatus Woesearchaeota archaeon]|nr:hypothetical protein [Candidatus Woesearchaeota archaeon]
MADSRADTSPPIDHDLIYFTGTECSHCKSMEPVITQVENDLKISFDRKEVWHNMANQDEFRKLAVGKCEGIPFFYNKKTGKSICGRASFEGLKAWAVGN